MRVLAALFLGLLLAACSIGSDTGGTDIRAALDRLIAHPDREERFVVIDHPSTEEFVQFDFEDGELAIDLPVIALTKEEQVRASTLFASVGVGGPTVVPGNDADNGKRLSVTTYRLGFGNDSAKATAFAARVFHEVYLLPHDASIAVTEGWGGP